ncbi:hypothetical protein EDC04DRAFT_1432031 [Pisolithus marmoratus]|nr:hypothetical protein EDC04DRAFT_1432031 [Pisolithus marmoratus]
MQVARTASGRSVSTDKPWRGVTFSSLREVPHEVHLRNNTNVRGGKIPNTYPVRNFWGKIMTCVCTPLVPEIDTDVQFTMILYFPGRVEWGICKEENGTHGSASNHATGQLYTPDGWSNPNCDMGYLPEFKRRINLGDIASVAHNKPYCIQSNIVSGN